MYSLNLSAIGEATAFGAIAGTLLGWMNNSSKAQVALVFCILEISKKVFFNVANNKLGKPIRIVTEYKKDFYGANLLGEGNEPIPAKDNKGNVQKTEELTLQSKKIKVITDICLTSITFLTLYKFNYISLNWTVGIIIFDSAMNIKPIFAG